MRSKIAFKGKTALITGASSGIGRQVALDLAALGVQVILVARRHDRLVSIQKEIESGGGKADCFVCDLEDDKARQNLITQILETKKVDILINNAGFGWYGFYADMPWAIAKSLVEVNITAMLALTGALLPGMRDRAYGHIINIGSIAGGFPNQGIAVYAASKAFMDAFTTALHREMRGSGVQVSVVRLGPVKTDFFDTARKTENGHQVPGEQFSISVERSSRAVVRLLRSPRRFLYVPVIFSGLRVVEFLFGWIIDKLGPLLLRKLPGHESHG
jgi:hypothetical protein